MTANDYMKTAEILREFCPRSNMDDVMNVAAYHNLVDQFSAMFADDNPRFDTKKFLEACGV